MTGSNAGSYYSNNLFTNEIGHKMDLYSISDQYAINW